MSLAIVSLAMRHRAQCLAEQVESLVVVAIPSFPWVVGSDRVAGGAAHIRLVCAPDGRTNRTSWDVTARWVPDVCILLHLRMRALIPGAFGRAPAA